MTEEEKLTDWFGKKRLCRCGHHITTNHTCSGKCCACNCKKPIMATNLDLMELLAKEKGFI